MEEIREQMDLANEINDAISQPVGEQFDEEELEDELRKLEEENLDEQFLQAPAEPASKRTFSFLMYPQCLYWRAVR